MTSQELMIGDWVRQKYSGLTFKVGSIITPYIRVANMAGQFEENTIEPIPLTAEILEKNGFETEKAYYGFVYVYDDDDKSLRIVFHPKESNYTRGAYSYIHIDCGCVTIEELPIHYVHELQHALRLCEIDKEIVL